MVIKLLDSIRRRKATDPACGMKVNTRKPPGRSFMHEKTLYYFCSNGCRLSFEEDPAAYLFGGKREEM